MTERFESEELDPATLEYLRTAARYEGEGMPGISLDAKAANLARAWLPLAGAFLGPCIVLATLYFTGGSVDDPINVAMLQTAGLVLGVWMFVAWLRNVIASHRPDYIGHFKLIDPLYLWHAIGRGVFVTLLHRIDRAHVSHKYDNNGNYSGARVTIFCKREKVVVDVKSEYLGERLAEFVNLLAELDGTQPAAQRGYDALDELNLREAEREDDPDSPPSVRRLMDSIPEPHKVRSVFTWWWRYPLVVGLFGFAFLCSWTVCSAMRDDEIFDLVKDRQALELRSYLVDRRNSRHRAEVMQRLTRWHDQAAQQIEARKNGDPQLTAGLASLVRGLGHEAQPVITIAVKQSQQDGLDQALFAPAGMQALRTELIKDLTEYLTPPNKPDVIAPELAAYGEVMDGHAMIHISSHVRSHDRPREARPGYRIDWTFTLQATPEAAKFVWKTQTESQPGAAANQEILRQQYREVMTRFKSTLPR
jgi:hypothetical protein